MHIAVITSGQQELQEKFPHGYTRLEDDVNFDYHSSAKRSPFSLSCSNMLKL